MNSAFRPPAIAGAQDEKLRPRPVALLRAALEGGLCLLGAGSQIGLARRVDVSLAQRVER